MKVENDEKKDDQHTCQFCGHYDPGYDENDMTMHYDRECPMVGSLYKILFIAIQM